MTMPSGVFMITRSYVPYQAVSVLFMADFSQSERSLLFPKILISPPLGQAVETMARSIFDPSGVIAHS